MKTSKISSASTVFALSTVLTSASCVAGCTGSATTTPGDSGTTASAIRASLHRAKGCGDLLADLKADARAKLETAVNLQIAAVRACLASPGGSETTCSFYGYGYGYGGVAENTMATGAPSAGASADAKSSAAAPASPPVRAATAHSETTTQVAGVDEADFVKTDGANLYLLHGRAFKIIKAWPAKDLKELFSIDIEGTPSAMFVDNGHVVVYSQVNGIGLYEAAGIKPKTQYVDYGYGGGGDVRSSMAIAPGVGKSDSQGVSGGYAPLTKMTVLTHDGTTARVTREVYFEGSYLDARRVGTHVRTVLQGTAHGPALKYSVDEVTPAATGTPAQLRAQPTASDSIRALEALRAANVGILNASVLEDWQPSTFTKNDSRVVVSHVACEDVYLPTAGTTEAGLTEIASIDLATPNALPRESAIFGRSDTVYGGVDSMVLAAQAWIEPSYRVMASGAVSMGSGSGGATASSPGSAPSTPPPAPVPAPAPGAVGAKTITFSTSTANPNVPAVTARVLNRTHLHSFEFASDANFPNYVASGTVPGHIQNQYSIDENANFIRIATTEDRDYVDQNGDSVTASGAGPSTTTTVAAPNPQPRTVNHVFVLGVRDGRLEVVGDAGELAPNEQIQSTRFVGSRGYVVTFRQVDPLFVFDLADPANPKKLAELKIPGFSEFMQPIDSTHLLTIGRDASDTGRSLGVQLQIFDVTDGAKPVLAHKFTYSGSEYGFSDAERDPKAFTYYADRNLLAFPYYASSGTGSRSSLELFRVDTKSGFEKLGALDHTALVSKIPDGACGGFFGPQVRRGVFIESFVFSLSYGGIIAKDTNNLGIPGGAQLALGAPQSNVDGSSSGPQQAWASVAPCVAATP